MYLVQSLTLSTTVTVKQRLPLSKVNALSLKVAYNQT